MLILDWNILWSSDFPNTNDWKQFIARKFNQYTANIGIISKIAIIKAYNFISMVKR